MASEKKSPASGIEFLNQGDQMLSAGQALIAMGEIGRHLQTVERQIRPQLLAQIENAGKRFQAIEETKQAGQLIALMCAFWRGDLEFPNLWNEKEMKRWLGES